MLKDLQKTVSIKQIEGLAYKLREIDAGNWFWGDIIVFILHALAIPVVPWKWRTKKNDIHKKKRNQRDTSGA
jgi:hypothetical protein